MAARLTNVEWLQQATQALSQAQYLDRGEAQLRARLLLDAVAGLRFAHLLSPDQILDEAAQQRANAWLERAKSGEPVPYILGHAPFFGLDWEVGHGVLIPRSETELLVESVLERLGTKPAHVADLGTGSGIIAGALALERPQWHLVATEISPSAREIARHNFAIFGLTHRIRLLDGLSDNWLTPLKNEPLFDAIVSNPPYIAREEIEHLQIEVRDFEPRLALDGGADGLTPYRHIAAQGRAFLKPEGLCAVEIGATQGKEVSGLFTAHGWRVEGVLHDLAGLSRVVLAWNA